MSRIKSASSPLSRRMALICAGIGFGALVAASPAFADTIETLGPPDGPHVVVVDCGVKRNIVRSLLKRGARVTVTTPKGAKKEKEKDEKKAKKS